LNYFPIFQFLIGTREKFNPNLTFKKFRINKQIPIHKLKKRYGFTSHILSIRELEESYSLASYLECALLIFNIICGKRLSFEGMTSKVYNFGIILLSNRLISHI
jgi:hypothetical protein